MDRAARTMTASHFKPRCLKLLDEIARTRQPLILTKRGYPIARIVPVEAGSAKDIFGCLAGEMRIVGDITEPIAPGWEEELLQEWEDVTAPAPPRPARGGRVRRRRAR